MQRSRSRSSTTVDWGELDVRLGSNACGRRWTSMARFFLNLGISHHEPFPCSGFVRCSRVHKAAPSRPRIAEDTATRCTVFHSIFLKIFGAPCTVAHGRTAVDTGSVQSIHSPRDGAVQDVIWVKPPMAYPTPCVPKALNGDRRQLRFLTAGVVSLHSSTSARRPRAETAAGGRYVCQAEAVPAWATEVLRQAFIELAVNSRDRATMVRQRASYSRPSSAFHGRRPPSSTRQTRTAVGLRFTDVGPQTTARSSGAGAY